MKNILLLAHEDLGQEARLQAALDLARALGGHLTCIDVSPLPVLAGEFYSAASQAFLLADTARRDAANREFIEARLAHENVCWDWKHVAGDLASSVARSSSLADLIVVNPGIDEPLFSDMRSLASSILVRSRTLLAAIPDDCEGFDAAGRALIAWNGTPEVAAAMRAAMPLLKLASSVQLFEVDDGSLEICAREAATYLSRHGIHPTIRRMRSHGGSIAKIIIDGCEVLGASYCLMGSYGGSRLMEAMFGGVTRDMLSESPIPLILGH